MTQIHITEYMLYHSRRADMLSCYKCAINQILDNNIRALPLGSTIGLL
jgi:hypothetical protein